MIVDRIENLSRYSFPMADEIAAYLETNDPLEVPVGEIEIHGRGLFVRTMEFETRAPSEGKFETHRIYADLQFVVRGAEVMQTAMPDALSALTEYDAAADCQFFKAAHGVSDLVVPTGCFAFFFPGEAHRPCCHCGGKPQAVKKLVFKVEMNP